MTETERTNRYMLQASASNWFLVDVQSKPERGQLASPYGQYKIVQVFSQSNEDYQRAQQLLRKLEEERDDA